MAGMKGVNSFLIARYIVFGLFIICNAITCSVAVLNFSLVHLYPQSSHVDVYLIVLGAFSLVSVFVLIFVELLCTKPFSTSVWFECAWVVLFWIMELAGGAALIAIESDLPCSPQGSSFLNKLCASERVLLAFTWTCTIMLLIYLLVLVFIAASQHHEDPSIWRADVRTLRPVAMRQCASNASTSPLTVTRHKISASVDTYTPRPVRSPPDHTFRHHKGLSSKYKIEPFYPAFVVPEPMDVPHSSNLREAIPLSSSAAAPIAPPFANRTVSLPATPEKVHTSLSQFDLPRDLVSSITYMSSSLPSGLVPNQSTSLPTPSPLGNWPRPDIMQQPVKRKLPPSAFEFPSQRTATTSFTERASMPADNGTQPRPRRPSGPRLRVPSGESVRHRPTPLNLSGISNYECGRLDVTASNV